MAVVETLTLLEVEAATKSILSEKDILRSLTNRQLRQRIAQILNVDEDLLETANIQQHIDTILLNFIEENPPVSQEKEEKTVSSIGNTLDTNHPLPTLTNNDDNIEAAEPDISKAKPGKIVKQRQSKGGPPPLEEGDKSKAQIAKEATIDRLKSYITKCGIRKVWKKELEGLSLTQSITRLEAILKDLGMEGRPTLEKCKAIKKRREFEEELHALKHNSVLESRLRSRKGNIGTSNEREESDFDHSGKVPTSRRRPPPRLNLLAFGDPED